MKENTFGETGAQLSLTSILDEIGDTHLRRKVGRIHTRNATLIKQLVRSLATELDFDFYHAVLGIVKTAQLSHLDQLYRDKLPPLVFTHLRNGIMAMFRAAMRDTTFYKAQIANIQRATAPLLEKHNGTDREES